MKLFDNDLRPEEFPLGSPESRAAARLLIEARKEGLIPVMCLRIINIGGKSNTPPMYCEVDPKLIGSAPHGWMTRQELDTKRREYDEYEAARRSVSNQAHEPREVTAPPKADSVPRHEPREVRAADAAPEKPEPDEESPDERVRKFIERRRPLARRGPCRRHRWPPTT